MICKNCGESYEGDGYKIPYHCPNSEDEDRDFVEPDANPIDCKLDISDC